MRRFMPEDHIWPEDYTQVHLPGDLCELPPSWIPYTAKSESELKFGPLWEYYDACDAESMAHRVSMAAAGFYRGSIERLRRGRPSGSDSRARCCGGYLAWKLNDSWPEIYGSKVDYFLEPYLPYFFMKRAYEPVLLSFDVGNFLHIWLVNDSAAPVSGRLVVRLFHITENKVTREASFMVSSDPDESVDAADLDGDLPDLPAAEYPFRAADR